MTIMNGVILFAFFFTPIKAMKALFPRTTVISLPRHTSRREHIIEEMSSKNVTFSWLNAVDGKNLTHSELAENATPLARWFMTPGMIGCFLSHRRCWEICVASDEPLLVFEDDVILASNFRAIVTAAMSQLSKVKIGLDNNESCDYDDRGGEQGSDSYKSSFFDWDVLLLGALGCVHPEKKFGLNWIPSLVGGKWRNTRQVTNLALQESADQDDGEATRNMVAAGDANSTTRTPFLHVPMCPYGMHAYILSPRGAAKLLKRCPRASYHVDVVAWGLKELDILAVHPLVAWQINNDMTIGGLVNVWRKMRILPTFVADQYTGFELGWAFCAPLLRIGGPFFGGKLMLTNGTSLMIMFAGIIAGIRTQSTLLLSITLIYVVLVASTVRLLASKWNS